MVVGFHDRTDAGRQLASKLRCYANRADVLLLALPRGGVPVAYEISRELSIPMDVFLVRKLGVPGHEELAMGAIASGGIRVLNQDLVRELGISRTLIDRVAETEERELLRRERAYHGSRPPPDLRGRTVILVDDGLATGATMRAAVEAARAAKAARVVVAVPVASPAACREFEHLVDETVCGQTVEPFYAVGMWYEDFSATTDEQVQDLPSRATHIEERLGPVGPGR
jgi:predicted phosphoribosyltransferase